MHACICIPRVRVYINMCVCNCLYIFLQPTPYQTASTQAPNLHADNFHTFFKCFLDFRAIKNERMMS